jgi:N-terminal acetyltransferase B complex non-catalytic subunit
MIDKTTCSINNQKFVYLLTISPLSSTSVEATKTINAFIIATLKTYSSSLALGTALLITDNQYGDDAALLSVMGLVRLYNMRPTDQAPLYQSIQILETLLQKSKHNYQALLLLVRIYLLIGAISSAFKVYEHLNIKQIQNDTLSHYLLTRISTLLPNDARTATFLHEAGGIYESSRMQTPNMLQLAFERGGYAQMMGFLEFSDRVAGSICRSMWEIELRRLSRLSPGYPDPSSITEVGYKSTIWDSRDFTVIIDCELSSVGPFEKSFRLDPTPAENWVRGFAAAEEVIQFLSSTSKDSNGTATGAVEKPTISPNAAGRIAKAIKAGEGEFTATEKTYLLLLGAVAELATAAVKKDSENVGKALQGVTSDSLPAVLSSLSEAPGWSLLHTLWLQKDACVVAELAGKFVSSLKGLKPKPTVAELNDKIKAGRLRISKAAEETQKKVEDDEATQVLVDAVLSEEGVGALFRRDEEVFGGVEKVAENVAKTRGAVGRSFEAAI